MEFDARLEACRSIADVFELVKEIAFKATGMEQAGLMVGLSDLGKSPNGFVGAFYSPNANTIILNNRILQRVKWTRPEIFKPYLFHLLLHEYIHSLGVYNEEMTRQLTYTISEKLENETVIQLAIDMGRFFPDIIRPDLMEMPEDFNIYFVKGIDRKNMNYIN